MWRPGAAYHQPQMIAMFLSPGNMRWLLISRGVRSFSQALLAITAPLYFAALGNSSTQVGLLLSLGAVGSTVLTLTTGFASDRVGRRPLLVIIALLSGLGAVVLSLNGAFALLALGGALCTVGGGGGATGGGNWGPFFPAEQPLIAGSVRDARRGEAFAAISTVGVIGGAAGALAAGVPALLQAQLKMPELGAYRVMFWVIAATAVLLTLALLPIREPAIERQAAHQRLSRASFGIIWRMWVSNAFSGFAYAVMGPFLIYWFHVRYGVGAGAIGALATVVNLCMIGAYVFSPRVARKLGSLRGIVVARTISVVLLVVLTLAPTFVIASAVYLLRLICSAVSVPIGSSYVMGISEPMHRSRVAALGGVPAQATGMAGPTIAGALLGLSVQAPMWMAVAGFGLGTATYGWLFRGMRPPEEIPPPSRGAPNAVASAR